MRTCILGVAVVGVVAMAVFAFLVGRGPYGEAPFPGTAVVHLPAGEVDVTVKTTGAPGETAVPPMSIRVSAPEGTPRPAVIDSAPQHDSFAVMTRVQVLHVEREADYVVEVDGEAYPPYQPLLVFRPPAPSASGQVVFYLGGFLAILVISTVACISAVIAVLALFSRLRRLW